MPEKFGGGKETENYLLKAISLSSTDGKSKKLPNWGEEESYELLIRWYIKKEMKSKAEKYYIKAKSKYAKSYRINQLANLF